MWYYIHMLNNKVIEMREDKNPYPFHQPKEVPSWMKPSTCNRKKK